MKNRGDLSEQISISFLMFVMGIVLGGSCHVSDWTERIEACERAENSPEQCECWVKGHCYTPTDYDRK